MTKRDKPNAPKKGTPERVMEYARAHEDPIAHSAYPAFYGMAGTTGELSVADAANMEKLEIQCRRMLARHIHENNMEWGVQITRIGVVPGSRVAIDVPEGRKASRFYAKAGVDAIVNVGVGPVPMADDPTGFGLAQYVIALVFGANARSLVDLATSKARFRGADTLNRTPMVWYAADDKAALKAELAKMFRPSLIKVPTVEGEEPEVAPEGWNTGESRLLRAFVTTMARSMLPAKKALVLVGEGKSMVTGALAAVEVSMKKARRASPPPVHPDGLPHFWFGELRRLGLNQISVPLIKLR